MRYSRIAESTLAYLPLGHLGHAGQEMKVNEKEMYDRARKVVTPNWKVGDLVLLHEDRVRPGFARVITRQRFVGPYIINNVVQGRSDVGVAYQLLHQKTGKIVRNLVTNDRLKAYNVDRQKFKEHLARLDTR